MELFNQGGVQIEFSTSHSLCLLQFVVHLNPACLRLSLYVSVCFNVCDCVCLSFELYVFVCSSSTKSFILFVEQHRTHHMGEEINKDLFFFFFNLPVSIKGCFEILLQILRSFFQLLHLQLSVNETLWVIQVRGMEVHGA